MKIIHSFSLPTLKREKTRYLLGEELFSSLNEIPEIAQNRFSSFFLLSTQKVFSLWGKPVISSLQKTKKPLKTVIVSSGEKAKNFSQLKETLSQFFSQGIERKSCLFSLGGGAICDLGGFLASILLRGISSVYLPTTLLAQIDAAIGGKTAVNFPFSRGVIKNFLGTFSPPEMVISDVSVLKTLPEKEIDNGLSEMVKYWIGWGRPSPFQLGQMKKIQNFSSLSFSLRRKLFQSIFLCQKIKAEIVQKDPWETVGLRAKLNLGHTLGHALEGVSGGKLSHGEAVVLGLLGAAKISLWRKGLPFREYEKIVQTINRLDLKKAVNPNFFLGQKEEIFTLMENDKKGGEFIFIKKIGKLEKGPLPKRKILFQALKEIL